MNTPLVSIAVLSYNRKAALRLSLTHIYNQSYKNIEVIVVDNASTDGSPDMVRAEFPNVTLFQLYQNTGISGWNNAAAAAEGEYILFLDDDSYPETDTIDLLLKFADKNPNTIIGLNVWNQTEARLEPINPIAFIGCGVFMSREVVYKVGKFEELLFIYEHEVEYCIRAAQKGIKLKYCMEAVVVHQNSPVNRTSKRRKLYVTRNILIVLTLHFSFHKVLLRLLKIIAGRGISGLKQGDLKYITRGIWEYVKIIPRLISKREPVSENVQKAFDYGAFAGGFHFTDKDWYN